ncbi:MAG TPA: OadG family transporter subunit [bacterium]|nr:OadG family transporter subunit [bacterium]
MTISSTIIAAAAVGEFSPREMATIEILPFIGIGVVIGGLALLAVILTQFDRLNGARKKAPAVVAPGSEKSLPGQATVASPTTSVDEDESAAVATAIALYLQQSAEPIAITEIPQDHHSTPWIDFGKQYQQYRFHRWQSSTRTR